MNSGILCRTAEPEGLVLGRPPEGVVVAGVFAVIERAPEIQVEVERKGENPAEQVLAQHNQALRDSFADVTQRFLALTASGIAAAVSVSGASDELDAEERESGKSSTVVTLTEGVPSAPTV